MKQHSSLLASAASTVHAPEPRAEAVNANVSDTPPPGAPEKSTQAVRSLKSQASRIAVKHLRVLRSTGRITTEVGNSLIPNHPTLTHQQKDFDHLVQKFTHQFLDGRDVAPEGVELSDAHAREIEDAIAAYFTTRPVYRRNKGPAN